MVSIHSQITQESYAKNLRSELILEGGYVTLERMKELLPGEDESLVEEVTVAPALLHRRQRHPLERNENMPRLFMQSQSSPTSPICTHNHE